MVWFKMPNRQILPPIAWAWGALGAFGRDLLTPKTHRVHVQEQLAGLITRRLRLIATIWFVLALAWLPVDLLVLPADLWLEVVVIRLISVVGYGFVAGMSHTHDFPSTQRRIALFFFFQIISALPAIELPAASNLPWTLQAIHTAYDDLPFVLIVAIGLFPLFFIDALKVALSVLLAAIMISLVQHLYGMEPFDPVVLWLLVLVGTLSVLSSATQMQAIIFQIEQAGRDPLTGALPRRVGEAVLESETGMSQRHQSAMTIVFLDLDRFKLVNDRFGHEAGDLVLRVAAENMRRALRVQDSLIRWGGEEFVIVLPQTGTKGAEQFLERLADIGLGRRPDGKKQTASLGVAELAEIEGQPRTGWPELVMLADQRMYAAKQAGRNQIGLAGGFKSFLAMAEAD